ncbi:MAG: hypothetical protein LBD45_02785 [Bacteroidales bacterium]|jgi:hypothetical protein|nr:hypothetical protein [Bacteroidales bacterium]
MHNSLVSIGEYEHDSPQTGFSARREQYCGCQPQYCCPQLRPRVARARILPSENGIFQSATETFRLKREILRSANGISSGKTGVIPVFKRNVAVKNRNIAVGERMIEVGDGNEGIK